MGKQDLFSSPTVAHLWTASFITHVFFCPVSVPGEQCFLNPVATDLYLTPSEVPPFDAKPADLLGGQHLKSLSAEPGALGPAVCCVSNIPPE